MNPQIIELLRQSTLQELSLCTSVDAATKAEMKSALLNAENPFCRKQMPIHITSSALVFNPELDQILLIHHKATDSWLQPGGHFELPLSLGNSERLALLLWHSAQREVLEETGVAVSLAPGYSLNGSIIPIDVDLHSINARPEKDEGAHWHIDFMYAAVAQGQSSKFALQLSEVLNAQWILRTELLEKITETSRIFRALERF